MEAFFPSAQYHRGWHGNLPAGSPAPNCASPPAGTGGLLLRGQNMHEKYLIKSNLCENLLGREKGDKIISLCLFPVEVSSMIPGQERFQKGIAANAAAFYFPSIVINPRLQIHLDSFQCNKYFTWRIHVGNSSFLDVFISQQTKIIL